MVLTQLSHHHTPASRVGTKGALDQAGRAREQGGRRQRDPQIRNRKQDGGAPRETMGRSRK